MLQLTNTYLHVDSIHLAITEHCGKECYKNNQICIWEAVIQPVPFLSGLSTCRESITLVQKQRFSICKPVRHLWTSGIYRSYRNIIFLNAHIWARNLIDIAHMRIFLTTQTHLQENAHLCPAKGTGSVPPCCTPGDTGSFKLAKISQAESVNALIIYVRIFPPLPPYMRFPSYCNVCEYKREGIVG